MLRRCLLPGVLAALALAGCGGSPRNEIRTAVIQDRHAEAERKLDDLYHHHLAEYGFPAEQVQNSRHLMLWRLERGSTDFIHGEDGNALAHFKDASRLARENRTRSVVRAVSAAAVNDNMVRWTGEPFETVRIPYYGMLANLLLAQRADGTWAPPVPAPAKGEVPEPPAVVDAETLYDRAASGATQVHESLRALAAGELGDTGYRADPFLDLVAAAVRSATARAPDDIQAARVYASAAAEGYARAGRTPAFAQALIGRIDGASQAPAGHGSVLVLEEVGFVPKRDALTIYVVTAAPPRGTRYLDLGWGFIYTDDPNPGALADLNALPLPGEVVRDITGGRFGVFGCEIPVMPRPRPRPAPGAIAVDGGGRLALEDADDVEAHARQCFADHQARRTAAIIIRTVAKLVAVRQGIGAAEQGNRRKHPAEAAAITDLLWFLGSALVTVSEQADVRCWGLLPNRVSAGLVDVPAGRHELTVFQGDGAPRTLGMVDVRAGQLAVVTLRSFPANVDHVGGGQ
jgi:hypothetical protein